TPEEYVLGMARQFGLSSVTSFAVDTYLDDNDDGQQFFQPPNVSGWPGYHDWITTNTYLLREMQAAGGSNSVFTLTGAIKLMPLSTAIGQLLLPRPLSSDRQTAFAEKLAGTTQAYEWASILANSPSQAAQN